jgi:DNA-binding MarR family transcriptional regulator
MSYEQLKLENQICFRIYSLNRKIHAAYQPYLKPLNLTYPQYIAMLTLWEHEQMTISQMCERLMLDTGTVSPLVKRLERLALVRRERDTDDERKVFVTLTQRGRDLQHEAKDLPMIVGSCLFEREGDEDSIHELARELDSAMMMLDRSSCQDSRS